MGSHRMNTDSEVLAEMLRIRGGRDGASTKTNKVVSDAFPAYCVGHIEVAKVQTELKNSVLPILQNCQLDRASCKPEAHIIFLSLPYCTCNDRFPKIPLTEIYSL